LNGNYSKTLKKFFLKNLELLNLHC